MSGEIEVFELILISKKLAIFFEVYSKHKKDGVAKFMITIRKIWVFSVLQNVSSKDILYDNLNSYFVIVKFRFQISKVRAAERRQY